MIDVDNPDDYMNFYDAIAYKFRSCPPYNKKKITLTEAYDFYKNEICIINSSTANPLKGIPGDGFIKNKKGIYAFVTDTISEKTGHFLCKSDWEKTRYGKRLITDIPNYYSSFLFKGVFEERRDLTFRERVLYIGKANSIRNRIMQHAYKPRIYNKIIQNDDHASFEVMAWYVNDNETLERQLISKYKPEYNTQYKNSNYV